VLVLVRHGQTEANARGLLLGRSDPPLSTLGVRQADALAAALTPVLAPEARVVASPLRRARETAEAFGRPVDVDERWIELDYGVFEGRPVSDVTREEWDTWRTDSSFTPTGGESLAALGIRVRSACRDLLAEARTGNVVVVSHVSPIKAAVAWALGADDAVGWRMFVAVGSIARVEIGPWGPQLVSFNERAGVR
jgi:broad specificity phosphatase PhoE